MENKIRSIKKTYPTSCRLWSVIRLHDNVVNKPSMSHFFARYALAYGFMGIKVNGYKEHTLRGYNALLKMQLVFSTLEMLIKAVGDLKHKVSVPQKTYLYILVDEKLEKKIRSNQELLKVLYKYSDIPLQKNLRRFMNFETQNLIYIASSIRHLMAHGVLTANGANLKLVKDIKVVEELSNTLLNFVDEKFSDFVMRFDEYVTLKIAN